MVTRIFAILGLMLIGTCYGIHLMPQTSYAGSYQNSYPQQIYGFMGYGGRSNPAGIRWNYKPNFKSPVVMIPNPTVEEPMMRSIVYQARPGQDPQRFFAKRSAPDMNPDFDHFSANRGKRSAGDMDPKSSKFGSISPAERLPLLAEKWSKSGFISGAERLAKKRCGSCPGLA